jgi:hypothetical protein
MADFQTRYSSASPARTADMAVDQGLRQFMLGIYNRMAGGVALTGIVAYIMAYFAEAQSSAQAVAQMQNGVMLTQFGAIVYGSWLAYVLMLAPLAFVLVISFGINKLSSSAANMVFWAFAAVMGMSIGSIFLVYTGMSIAQTFFAAAAAFGALSLWGYTTKKDLSGWGSFLIMGVIGLIIASVINIFLQSSMMSYAISAIGVLIFAGLTAYDTQRLKNQYYEIAGHAEAAAKASIFGALSLYINFINMFMFLLQFMGQGRE